MCPSVEPTPTTVMCAALAAILGVLIPAGRERRKLPAMIVSSDLPLRVSERGLAQGFKAVGCASFKCGIAGPCQGNHSQWG